MKLKETKFSKLSYIAPEVITVEIAAEGILCYSTERMEEDNINPWAM